MTSVVIILIVSTVLHTQVYCRIHVSHIHLCIQTLQILVNGFIAHLLRAQIVLSQTHSSVAQTLTCEPQQRIHLTDHILRFHTLHIQQSNCEVCHDIIRQLTELIAHVKLRHLLTEHSFHVCLQISTSHTVHHCILITTLLNKLHLIILVHSLGVDSHSVFITLLNRRHRERCMLH